MKKIGYLTELTLLIIFNIFVLIMPLQLTLLIGRRLGDIAFFVLKIRRNVVVKNLLLAFPNKNSGELFDIARRTYQNFGMSMIELLSFPKLNFKKLINNKIEFEGLEFLDELLAQKQGAILVAGHFGSWELMGAATCQKGYPLAFLVGKQHNIYVDNLLNYYRKIKKIGIIQLKMALKGVMKAVKTGRFVAMLSDQDAGKRDGVFVNFFSRPASTPKGPAVFSLRLNVPIVIGFCIRQKQFSMHKIKFLKIDFEKTGNYELDVELLTSKYTQILENFIKKYPDHWFWFHKRWKTIADPTIADDSSCDNISSKVDNTPTI
ncbi:MAG: lysophospholipid acyltransferase family protein [Elusimicrobiota bacterium]